MNDCSVIAVIMKYRINMRNCTVIVNKLRHHETHTRTRRFYFCSPNNEQQLLPNTTCRLDWMNIWPANTTGRD